MKKKFPISLFPMTCLIVGIALALYAYLYFFPARQEAATIESEIKLHEVEQQIYAPYVNDHSPIEQDIAAAEAEIERLHREGYVTESEVSLILGEAILKHNVTLNELSIGNSTTYKGYQALPIRMELTGQQSDILGFMSAFENDTEGSYIIQAASMNLGSGHCTASVTMYLCTPQPQEQPQQ